MITNPYDVSVKHYKSDVPLSAMTVGQAQNWGNQLINLTRGDSSLGLKDGYGSSAKGAYQMTNPFIQNWGEKAFGKDLYTRKFDKDTQEGIMDYYINHNISNKNYGQFLSDFQGLQKTGITSAQLSTLTPEQIRNAILATETGKGLPKNWANDVASSGTPQPVPAVALDNKANYNVTKQVTPVEPQGLAATYQDQQPPKVVQVASGVPAKPAEVPASDNNLHNTTKTTQSPVLELAQVKIPDLLSGLAANSQTNQDKYNKRLRF